MVPSTAGRDERPSANRRDGDLSLELRLVIHVQEVVPARFDSSRSSPWPANQRWRNQGQGHQHGRRHGPARGSRRSAHPRVTVRRGSRPVPATAAGLARNLFCASTPAPKEEAVRRSPQKLLALRSSGSTVCGNPLAASMPKNDDQRAEQNDHLEHHRDVGRQAEQAACR